MEPRLALTLLVLVGCSSGTTSRDRGTNSPAMGVVAGNPGGGASGVGGSAGTQAPSLPPPPPGTGVPPLNPNQGCKKVDFLFVIDNSSSMRNEQDSLITSFPGFVSAIEHLSGVRDYHIMIVDTDEDGKCRPHSGACMEKPEVCGPPHSRVCRTARIGCDIALGAGVVEPLGLESSNRHCALSSGARYIDATEPNLGAAFECTARLGISGHAKERPMDAMLAALDPGMNGPGGCNEGFLRKDAILVVTFISDDSKYNDAGRPNDWYNAVVAAKAGDPKAIVVLGLLPDVNKRANGQLSDRGQHWEEFVDLFGALGGKGDVQEPSYAPFFERAVALIDTTCDGFVPPPL